jgi:extracellular factor (EF) 3-hydroxypalmitic acid methyl ester biosynthesis protein
MCEDPESSLHRTVERAEMRLDSHETSYVHSVFSLIEDYFEGFKGVSLSKYTKEVGAEVRSQIYSMHEAIFNLYENYSGIPDEVRAAYRERFASVLSEIAIAERNAKCPLGFRGDYETLEMMYRNGFEGTTERGQFLHKALVDGRECESVRERKKFFRNRIIDLSNEAKRPVKICSVACGPARELRELPSNAWTKVAIVTLLDQDKNALDYAFNNLSGAARRKCELVQAGVVDILSRKEARWIGGEYDYIYSAGLFDYLDDAVAKVLVNRLVERLSPGGVLDLGNFEVWPIGNFCDLGCGWRLILRDESRLRLLSSEGSVVRCEKVADQLVLSVRRPV